MFKSKRAENGNGIPITGKQKPERWKETSKTGDYADGEKQCRRGTNEKKGQHICTEMCAIMYKSMYAIRKPQTCMLT